MKMLVKKGILEAAVAKAKGMVSKEDVRPILKNFLLQLDPAELKIMATDEELAAVASVRVLTVKEPGSITVPAMKFSNIVEEAPDVEGELSLEGSALTIKFGRSVWKLQGMSADQYPKIGDFEGDNIVKFDREKMLASLKKIGFAAGKDATRPSLMGVYFDLSGAYATDGHRIQVMNFTGEVADLLIPAPAVAQLVRVLDLSGAKIVEIVKKERYILFRVGSDIYSSRMLEASYPDVSKIVGKSPLEPRLLKVDKDLLMGAIKRVRITANEESRALKLQIKKSGVLNELWVSSLDDKGNAAEEVLSCNWSANGDFVRGVNCDYLMELLQALDGKEVAFRFGEDKDSKQSPFRVEEGQLVGLILPLRLTF